MQVALAIYKCSSRPGRGECNGFSSSNVKLVDNAADDLQLHVNSDKTIYINPNYTIINPNIKNRDLVPINKKCASVTKV